MKEEILKSCIKQGNEYGFISWDGILDNCDEDLKLVRFCCKKLEKMKSKGEIDFELDF